MSASASVSWLISPARNLSATPSSKRLSRASQTTPMPPCPSRRIRVKRESAIFSPADKTKLGAFGGAISYIILMVSVSSGKQNHRRNSGDWLRHFTVHLA
ncbi:MAG: hypothetical protein HC841_01070 [Verrucomicrobiae bacterium]|nr:hypothetical protein [Verrucomicrobiae bacterium]